MREVTGRRLVALALSLILFAAVFVWDIPSSYAEEPPTESSSAAPAETAEPEPTEAPAETPLPSEESSAEPTEEPLPELTQTPVPEPTEPPAPEPELITEAQPNPAMTIMPSVESVGSAKNLYELLDAHTVFEAEALLRPYATSGDYDYVINPDTISVTITGYHGVGGNVTIPDTIDGKTVTSIGEEAFADYNSLTSVTIPNNVTTIGTAAFYLCESLTDVTFGNGIQSVGDFAFEACGLNSLSIPASVTAIGVDAFGGCIDLAAIDVDEANPVYISDNGVLYNRAKTVLLQYPAGKAGSAYSVPNGVSVLEEGAFEACFNLNSITLPSTVSGINQGVFAFCFYLRTVNIPDGVNRINDFTFYMCESLQNMQLPDSIGTIGYSAYFDCLSLTKIIIPSAVTDIGDYAFNYCESLRYAYFKGNAPQIGQYVFDQCVYYFTVFYIEGKTGFADPWNGYSTCTKDPEAKYTITFDLQDGRKASCVGSYNMIVNQPDNPYKYLNTFVGWYPTASCDTQPVVFPYRIKDNATLYAKWEGQLCWVTYSLIGFPMNSFRVPYGTVITNPPQPELDGFLFSGWFPTKECNTAPVTFPYTVTNLDLYFYAKWIRLGPYLTNVSISDGKLSYPFDSGLRVYKVMLGEDEPSVTISCEKLSNVSMTINGKAVSSTTVSLANGKSKKVTIKVKCGKKSNTYKFTVTRAKSSDNNLASLTASTGTMSQPFDPNVANYTLNLDENTKSVTLNAVKSNVKARVSPSRKRLTLKNGQTKVIKFTVKAQSGARKTYYVTVTRAPSTNTNLKTLRTSVPLSQKFNTAVTDYTITLPPEKSTVSISARAFDRLSKVTIDGLKKSSKRVTIQPGQSMTVSVVVTSQAGTTKEYRILIQRLPALE